MEEESLKKLKVAELKELLQTKGLPVAGKKEELIQRLLTVDNEKEEQQSSAPTSPKTNVKPTLPIMTETPIKEHIIQNNESKDEETVTIKSSQSKNALAMTLSLDEVDRIRARQARFGTTAPILQELEEARKLEERRQRFATNSNSSVL